MTGEQLPMIETKLPGGCPYNQICLDFAAGTEGDLSPTVFRESGDIIAKDQFNASRFEFLADEFPELIREPVVQ